MTKNQVLKRLRAAVQAAGGQRAFAATHRMSQPHLSLVLSGRTEPGPVVLRAIGLERKTTYVTTRGDDGIV